MQPTLDPRMPFFHARAKSLDAGQNRHRSWHLPSLVVFVGGGRAIANYLVPSPRFRGSNLSLGAPDVLQQTVPLSEAVHGVIALAHGPDESAESVDVVLARNGAAVLVNLGNRNLDRAVVLGLDDAVGGTALAGDVAARKTQYQQPSSLQSRNSGRSPHRSTISPRSFSILTVLEGCCGLGEVLSSVGCGRRNRLVGWLVKPTAKFDPSDHFVGRRGLLCVR